MTIIGTVVQSIYDDSDYPLTGCITGQVDEERVEVAWDDERSNPRVEWIDELTPRRPRR